MAEKYRSRKPSTFSGRVLEDVKSTPFYLNRSSWYVRMKMDIMEFLPERVRELVSAPHPEQPLSVAVHRGFTLLRHGAARHEIKPLLQAHWSGKLEGDGHPDRKRDRYFYF